MHRELATTTLLGRLGLQPLVDLLSERLDQAIEGAEVQYQNSAIGGDPMELSVFGTAISVRKQQADCFKVSPLRADV